jgi:hypothetical protein
MKTLSLMLMAWFCHTMTPAQPSAEAKAPESEKMKIFAAWTGDWKGEGRMFRGNQVTETTTVNEHIEFRLNGTILVVEGIGKMHEAGKGEKTVHHAYGILNYDHHSGSYKFRSYLHDGKYSDAWFNVVEENRYQWGLDIPAGGKVRYTITINPEKKTWYETGEYSRDGSNWMQIFEMNLSKI